MLADYFKKINKKIFESKGADPLKTEITPYRDWKILVVVFFIAIASSIGFNVYMLIQINNDNFFNSVTERPTGPVLNRDRLTAVLAMLAEKDALISGKATSTPFAVDPSR